MRQLVCISGDAWKGVPTRTQQLMSRMKDTEVLFFQPAQSLHSGAWKEPGRMLRPGLHVYTLPPVLSAETARGLSLTLGRRRLDRFLQNTLDRHHFREPVLWCSTPEASQLLDSLAYRGLVYDCYRDWPDYPDDWEGNLALAADVVFAASPELVHHISPCNHNAVLLPNGANHPMFARDNLPRPAGLQRIRGPILGYVGSLWPDLDLEPALYAVRSRPDCTLVLVGPDRGNPMLPELLEEPNVVWADFVSPVDLPDYVCNFDVCLYLLRRSRIEDDVIHARLFEYLSTGNPIVAMLRPGQVEHFPDVIYGAHSVTEFATLCSRALDEAGRWAFDRRRAYGRAGAWSERSREVRRILESIGLF